MPRRMPPEPLSTKYLAACAHASRGGAAPWRCSTTAAQSSPRSASGWASPRTAAPWSRAGERPRRTKEKERQKGEE